MKALLLLNVEPTFDAADPSTANAALAGAGLVVALTPFKDAAVENADVLLPIAPFTETSGTFINAEGRVQSFTGVVKPLGDTRPAWKVLRVLGNLLGLQGFDFESSQQVLAEALGDAPMKLTNAASGDNTQPWSAGGSIEPTLGRLADVPIYCTDALVRRAPSLQLTADARNAPAASLPSKLWRALALQAGDRVRVSQGSNSVLLPAREDPSLADGAVRVPAGHSHTADLGAMFGAITVQKA
jgi:NADH-quinone oxidoreductase subunit G